MRTRAATICLIIVSIVLSFAASVSAQTTINFWTVQASGDSKPVNDQLIKEFEKQNPDIKVKVLPLTWSNVVEKLLCLSSEKYPIF